MAKCNLCMKVKGKRKCKAFGGEVCSVCCGTSRNEAGCTGCSYFKPASQSRRYDKTPRFSTQQMADRQDLEDAGNVIEGAMCKFDMEQNLTFKDGFFKNVIERLLDRYAFGDQSPQFADDMEKKAFTGIESAIKEDLPGVNPDFLVKLIGTVHRSIKRHADHALGGRAYIDFIQQYVGSRVATDVRAISLPRSRDAI